MQEIKKNQTLKKNVGAVHISNPLSAIQRKGYSILLHNAYFNLERGEGEEQKIRVTDFCDLMGYNSKNIEYLMEQMKELQREIIVYLYETKGDFMSYNFFSSFGLVDGEVVYSYHKSLEKKFFNPQIFAQINILSLRDFKSGYTIALYENLSRYAPRKGFPGLSPKWSIEEFRGLMGVEGKVSYKNFRELMRVVIAPALKEMEEVGDLIATLEKFTKGRKITHLQFTVKRNPQKRLDLIMPEKVKPEAETDLAVEVSRKISISSMQSAQWILDYGEERVKEVLSMCQEAMENGSIKKSVAGWFVKALEGEWKKEKSPQEIRKEEKAKREEKKQKLKKKKEEAEALEESQKEEAKEKAFQKIVRHLDEMEKGDREKKYYIPFYQDHEEVFKGLSDFLTLGADPRECKNEMVVEWFKDFMSEKMGL